MALPAGRVIPQPPFVFDDKDIISPRAYIDLRWSPSQYLTDADGVFLDDRVDLETIQFDQNRPFEWLVFDKRFILLRISWRIIGAVFFWSWLCLAQHVFQPLASVYVFNSVHAKPGCVFTGSHTEGG